MKDKNDHLKKKPILDENIQDTNIDAKDYSGLNNDSMKNDILIEADSDKSAEKLNISVEQSGEKLQKRQQTIKKLMMMT